MMFASVLIILFITLVAQVMMLIRQCAAIRHCTDEWR
jgi:hypothetical protein